MATSDDPPFLTVGTEVSAKYRGAFCEATIKVAKKLVKCKVSYSKGNTALVANEVVKGTLKVGSPVEVRQPDGQYLAASVVKLTDQSTYTVVFDDGDERTLKRSSLCLKGGRHFDKSESLDNLPLTDPENFGTPVFHSTKKPSRKRRRCSQSPSRKEEENGKRPCSYPERFPVGKAVFLENDRRRSCWLPAVIVPAHYVMEESDRTPDTICLRSFKDGRFFASTKDELHDFAPDKEPLLSMLEGDVQPMYMCKPAIERAMAYLDTGELPWDMDLFDKTIEHRSATPTDEEETGDEVTAEVEEFNKKLKKFHESKGTPMVRRPTLGQKDLNLFKLYKLVKENGGMEKVTQELKWRSLYLQMGMPSMTNASYAIKQAYKKYLYAFEMHEKGGKGGKQSSVKESPGSWTNQRRKRNLDERSSEERERSSVVEKPPAPKMSKVVVKEEDPEEEVERLEVMSQNDAKSEVSDQDSSSQAENSSSNGDDCSLHFDGYANVKLEDDILTSGVYKSGDRIKVFYGKGKNQCLYEAKIIGLEEGEMGRDYLVHYNGWNTRYDEWINEARIAEKVTGPSKATRPQYAKKKANKKKAMQTRASSDGPSGTNVPYPSSSSAPSSTMATPQQPPHYSKRKMSESGNETMPTPLSSGNEKLSMAPNHHKHPAAATGLSCPLTPVTVPTSTVGKMLNGGGHLPSQQNHHASGSKSGGSGSNGKGSGRGAKRRRPSQATETPPHQMTPGPVVGSQAHFATNSSATSTPNHIPAVTMVPNFVTPVTTPISSVTPPPSGGHMTDLKRIEGDSVCSVSSPMPVFTTVPPVRLMTTTTSQQPVTLNHKHTPATNRGGVASGLNGSVCDVSSGTMSKNDRLGKGHHNNSVKVKRERSEERTTGWPNVTATPPVTTAAMRDFPPSIHHGGLKPEMAQMSRAAEVMNIFPPHLLQMHNVMQQAASGPPPPPPVVATVTCTPTPPPLQQQQQQAIDAAASALFCSERVPGMMSGDLKPVVQPVRHVSAARHSPSPRARPSIPLKKIDVDAFSTRPESYSSSIPQHPVDSPSSMSQSATELSPSPPCSPIHPSNSSSKKLHHSSSSSSLSSSFSGSAPSSAAATLLVGKNGVLRPTESTIQERGEAEEARIDMDESSAQSQDSPSSSTMSDNSSSEKERSPPAASEQHHHSRSKGSQSPDTGKRRRRSYETEEQYEERRKARRAKLNFMVDFAQLPVMSSTEKVVLIEEQMKTIQKKWVELKTEVNNLDRKRRKARKKEREAARLAASQAQAAATAMAGSCGSAGARSRHSASPLSAGNTATSEGGGGAGTGGRPTPPVAVECH